MAAWGPPGEGRAGGQGPPPGSTEGPNHQPGRHVPRVESVKPYHGVSPIRDDRRGVVQRGNDAKAVLGAALLLAAVLLTAAAAWALRRLWPARYAIGAVLAAGEVAFFFLWYRRRYAQLNEQPKVHAPQNFDAMRVFERFVSLVESLPDGVDTETYLGAWFRGAPVADIKRGNMEELMAYGFWYRTLQEMQAAGHGDVPGRMVDQLERLFDHKFPLGYNERLAFMSHLWEPLRAEYRPLLFYMGMEVVALCTRQIMASFGFERFEHGCLAFYTYRLRPGPHAAVPPPPAAAPPPPAHTAAGGAPAVTRSRSGAEWTPFAAVQGIDNPLNAAVPLSKDMPIVFCHGVGGLSLYLEMIKYILDLGHPVLCLEYKHVSLRLTTTLPTIDDVTRDVVEILDKLDIEKACVVGHSYGTFVASRLVQQHRDRVHTLCLIDPVCFGMFMPHLLSNFVYRRPRLNVWQPDVLLRDLMLYFASRDLHLSATFARRFYWSDMNLWPEDMPPGSVVLLSGNDDLVHAEEVRLMLEQSGSHIKVMYNPHLWHGAFLLDPEVKSSLASEIQGMLARTGSLAYRLTKPVVQRGLHAVHTALSTVGSIRMDTAGEALAALSGSILNGTFSVGGGRRRTTGRGGSGTAAGAGTAAAGPRSSAGATIGGGGALGARWSMASGARAGQRASADGALGGGSAAAAALGSAAGSGGGSADARVLLAQHSLDRAMKLCSAVLEERFDALENAFSTDRAAAGAAMIAEATAAALLGAEAAAAAPSAGGDQAAAAAAGSDGGNARNGLVQRRRPLAEAEGAGVISASDGTQ